MDPKNEPDLGLRPVGTALATGLAILYTLLLVVPFYISPTTRPSPTLSRDHPSVIRTRVRLVTQTCLLCAPISIAVLRTQVGLPWREVWRLLGWWPVGGNEVLRALLLTSVLFAGPLYERAIVNGGVSRWITGVPLTETMGSWIGVRNYVVGPLSEEFLFRSLLTPLYLLSKLPSSFLLTTPLSPSSSTLDAIVKAQVTKTILLSPLPFALAHLHHLHASRLTHPNVSLLPLVLASLLQFTYTAIFGWFAAFVFVRTASLPAVVLVHSFANWMGLPKFWGWVGNVPQRAVTARGDDGRGKGDGKWQVLLHTAVYYGLLVVGAFGFKRLLWPLTESEHGLVRGF